MKRIFLLIFSFSFLTKSSGDINRSVSLILTLTAGLFCYVCSAFANEKGFYYLLADYGDTVQFLGKIMAYIIDPLTWISIVTLYVFVQTRFLIDNDKDVMDLLSKHKSFKGRFIVMNAVLIGVFSVLSCFLVFSTYKISQFGAGKYSASLAETTMKPNSLSSATSSVEETKAFEISRIEKYYSSKFSELKDIRKEKKTIADKADEFAKRGAWTKHTESLSAKKWLDSYDFRRKKYETKRDTEIKSVKDSYDGKYNDIQNEHANLTDDYNDYKASIQKFSENAVNIWTLMGVAVLIVSCLLTTENFNSEALHTINLNISDWKSLTKEIKDSRKKDDENKSESSGKRSAWTFDEWVDKHEDLAFAVASELDSGKFRSIDSFLSRHKDKITPCNRADISYVRKSYKHANREIDE